LDSKKSTAEEYDRDENIELYEWAWIRIGNECIREKAGVAPYRKK